MINIQGLAQQKQIELERNITSNTILCITETQHKVVKVNVANNLEHIHSYREKEDREGGGLSIIMKQSDDKSIKK